MKKRLFNILLSIVLIFSMVFGGFPIAAKAESHEGQVRVIVENNVYSEDDGAPWDGVLIDTWVNIDNDTTMMTAVASAIEACEYSQTGAESGYISEINGLSAFDGGSMSGWMGTLNDLFTSEGFSEFSVANGKLEAGDEIDIQYSINYGEDISSSWGNNNKTIENITINVGYLSPEFDCETHEYTLTVPTGTTSLTVTPTASNKNFMVKTTCGDKEYKRSSSIPVAEGTKIYVECGNPDWPSMNNGYAGAELIESEVYVLNVTYENTPQVEYAKLDSLIVSTTSIPSNTNVLLKNSSDTYGSTDVIFDKDTYSYTLANQKDSQTSLYFRAKPADDDSKVTLYYGNSSKDITWSSGSSKFAACLSAGINELKIVVTPGENSNKEKSTYVLHLSSAPSLSGLLVSLNGKEMYLDKTFSATTYEYSVLIPDSTEKLLVAATPKKSTYNVTYNGSNDGNVDITNKNAIDIQISVGTGEAQVSTIYRLNLNKQSSGTVGFNVSPSDTIVSVYDNNGEKVTKNPDGTYSGMFAGATYTYVVSKYGYITKSGRIPSDGGVINVSLDKAEESGIKEVSSQWKNFRNSDSNMAITDVLLPTSVDDVFLNWNAKLGSGWSATPSVQIIVDNSLIVMSGTTLYKLDLTTGETVATATMVAAPNFGYTPPTYGGGMIYCPLTGGKIQAFNAKTLESVWIYTDNLGGQSLSPITYKDGYIYTGFWGSETKKANFVCINVTDEDISSANESKLATWKWTEAGGFYWAGSVVVGDAVIVGTDDGASGTNGSSNIYSFNRYTGELISSLDIVGDQRSSIAYDNGRIYFTSKSGYLYSASVNTSTGELSDLKGVNYNAQTTSTPVVYGGRVYIGVGSGISSSGSSGNIIMANADTLELMGSVGMKGYPQCSLLLTTAYVESENCIYLYSTYNAMPGGISMVKVDLSKTDSEALELLEVYDAAGYEKYCITSLICDEEGTIYYKNDSGNVLAVGIPDVTKVVKSIKALGTITINSKGKLETARKMYELLSDEDKELVSNYSVLVEAEELYNKIEEESKNEDDSENGDDSKNDALENNDGSQENDDSEDDVNSGSNHKKDNELVDIVENTTVTKDKSVTKKIEGKKAAIDEKKKKVEEIDEATEENIGEATDTSSNNYDIVDSTENMEPLKNTNKALYIWLSILGGALLIGAGAGAVLIFIRKKS